MKKKIWFLPTLVLILTATVTFAQQSKPGTQPSSRKEYEARHAHRGLHQSHRQADKEAYQPQRSAVQKTHPSRKAAKRGRGHGVTNGDKTKAKHDSIQRDKKQKSRKKGAINRKKRMKSGKKAHHRNGQIKGK